MSKPRLTDTDYCRAADMLGCEVASIKAVAEQESLGAGFDSQDRPVILFERHLFHKFTHGKYDKSHPGISNAVPGGYGSSASQYGRFSEAFALDSSAAMKSASWGKFQILGMNFAVCGYHSVDDFVNAMKESEGRQLDAFCAFVLHNGLDIALTDHDWAAFASGYNGKGYRKNSYDTKIAAGYAKFSKQHIDCGQQLSATVPATPPTAAELSATSEAIDSATVLQPATPEPSLNPVDEVTPSNPTVTETTVVTPGGTTSTATTTTVENTQDVNVPATVETNLYQGTGFIGALKKDFAVVGGGNLSLQTLQEYATDASGWPPWLIAIITKVATLVIVAGIGWLAFRLIHYIIWKVGEWRRQSLEATINSDTSKKNISFT